MAKFRYIKQFYKHFVQFTRRFQENSESSWKISDMKMLVTFTKWWKNGKLWKARCWVLSDCLIVQSRHAKSFSRFLLDTDEPILVTRGLGLWNIEEEGGDLQCHTTHQAPGAPSAPLLHAIDAVPMLHIMNNFNKIFGCRKKTKFSQSPAERELHSTLLALEIGTKLSRTSCGKHYFKAAELEFPAFSHHKEGFLDWNVKEFLKQHLG